MSGQILIVTGTSGAGKTTTITEFTKRSPSPYLMFGFDTLFGTMVPAKYSMLGDQAKLGFHFEPKDPTAPDAALVGKFGDVAWKTIEAFHEMIASASRLGQNVAIDHFMFLDPPILQDCVRRLKGLPVLFVALKPPYEVLMERLATRSTENMPDQMADVTGSDDPGKVFADILQRMTPWFYEATYENDCFDLVLDTTKLNPEEIAEKIEARMAEGPGTAFPTLQQRYQSDGVK